MKSLQLFSAVLFIGVLAGAGAEYNNPKKYELPFPLAVSVPQLHSEKIPPTDTNNTVEFKQFIAQCYSWFALDGVLSALTHLLSSVYSSRDDFTTGDLTPEQHKQLLDKATSLFNYLMNTAQKTQPDKDKNTDKNKDKDKDKNKDKDKPRPTTTPAPKPKYPTSYGMARIHYEGEGYICSAIHLTPWILLTSASCVRGRDTTKLKAMLLYKEGKQVGLRQSVMVENVSIHPKYYPKRHQYNYAMLNVYAKSDWDVDQFSLVRHNFTTEEIIKEQINTKVSQVYEKPGRSDEYYIRTFDAKFTPDFEMCDEIVKAKNWYCAEKNSGNNKFSQNEIGAPVFYSPFRDVKRLLGLYTGRLIHRDMRAHVYESVYPGLDFIESYVAKRPLPPSY